MVIKEFYNEYSLDGRKKYPKTDIMFNDELTKQLAMHCVTRTANGGLKMRVEFEDEFGNDSSLEITIDGDEIKNVSELIKQGLI